MHMQAELLYLRTAAGYAAMCPFSRARERATHKPQTIMLAMLPVHCTAPLSAATQLFCPR